MMNSHNKPKIIHYCWFGNKELPDLEKKCVESWKKYLPDYKFMLWNEKTFDVHSSRYSEQAFDLKKYAYVSDYARTVVLYEYGGTYLDTDVEIKEGFRDLIESHENVLSFQTSRQIGTGIISLCPQTPLMSNFIKYYHQREFYSNGVIDYCDNTNVLTHFLLDSGLILNKQSQKVGDIDILSRDYFCPKKISEKEFKTTSNTVAIHYGTGSWMTDRQRKRGNNFFWIKVCRPILCKIRNILNRSLGYEKTRKFEKYIRNIIS